ncbi:phosphate acetyltransferase [Spiroplasma cantharicola]|uniref:Phosphate acetyltransferase n=1 Tax=Spiroplasma cantharicola TaxID=362837 RepID=A0A0M5KCI8_9MOLU|nr:phosphate acetyltransferase [Spiroplasma cantharicola]ALD66793.1 phosphotransacetylase [Spiroplasma cantharicola]
MWSIKEIENKIKAIKKKQTIVFPEGTQEKIQQNATFLVENDLAIPVLLFNTKSEVPNKLHEKIQVVIIDEYDKQEMIKVFLEVRKDKADEPTAKKLMNQRTYFGVMMMKLDLADAMICGLEYTTADTLRPALQIIKTSKKYSIASSVFLMSKEKEIYLFTDCALNVDPNANQLADIASMSADFAQQLNEKDVQVAMLSYSTSGSGMGPSVDKVKEAVNLLKAKSTKGIIFDGEMQFDSAFDKSVRVKKYPTTKITKEHPDVYVFPDLNSGNIGYKIAQRFGNFQAAGPFILGLNKPVNDLSRGATLEDIKQTSIVTIYTSMFNGGDK